MGLLKGRITKELPKFLKFWYRINGGRIEILQARVSKQAMVSTRGSRMGTQVREFYLGFQCFNNQWVETGPGQRSFMIHC